MFALLVTFSKGAVVISPLAVCADDCWPASASGPVLLWVDYLVVPVSRSSIPAAFRAKGGDVNYEYDHSANLVALQGPAAAAVLPRLLAPADAAAIARMPFMTGRPMPVMGVQGCIVTRCGYTGEDGFEIAMPAHAAERITRALLDHAEVRASLAGP